MKATALLQQQHRKVEAILEAVQSGKEPSGLLKELANDLAAHMAIEQNIFYPAVSEVELSLVEESFEEHAIAEVALKRVLKTSPRDAQFIARVSLVQQLIRHHVEEEEKALFPMVEKAVASDQLEALGAQMEEAFAAAQSEGFEALVPETFGRTSADEALERIESEARESAGMSNGGGAAPPRERVRTPSS